MNTEIMLSYIVALIMSSLLVPVVKKMGLSLDIIAHQNNRTVHNGKIVRIGGYAVYITFLICALIFLKTDQQINSILISSSLIFLVGLYDDMNDLSAKLKLVVELVAATIIIFYGNIQLKVIDMPEIPVFISTIVSVVVTYGWIVGITNAMNLIDGLDGLCAGIGIIVLFTITFSSLFFGRTDIAALSLLLAGSVSGFLIYNFYPASIFFGDSGALFLGFMISVISLLGFGYKSSAFFTLGAPIIVLAVPIMDTIIAIIRRKLNHKKFSEADKGHLHHQLMFNLKLGHQKSVLILYLATFLFSLSSYLYLYDKFLAILLFIVLIVCFELFVEYTQMISRKYRPILTILNIFIKSDKLPILSSRQSTKADKIDKGENSTMKKTKNKINKKVWYSIIVAIVLVLLVGGTMVFLKNQKSDTPVIPTEEPTSDVYPLSSNPTPLLKETHDLLMQARNENNKDKEMSYVAAYFATDFFTWSNKTKREDIGGILYVLENVRQDFASFALRDYYADFTELQLKYKQSGLPEVSEYVINSIKPSELKLQVPGFESAKCYDIDLNLSYLDKPNGMPTKSLKNSVVITVVENQGLYNVVGVDYMDAN